MVPIHFLQFRSHFQGAEITYLLCFQYFMDSRKRLFHHWYHLHPPAIGFTGPVRDPSPRPADRGAAYTAMDNDQIRGRERLTRRKPLRLGINCFPRTTSEKPSGLIKCFDECYRFTESGSRIMSFCEFWMQMTRTQLVVESPHHIDFGNDEFNGNSIILDCCARSTT